MGSDDMRGAPLPFQVGCHSFRTAWAHTSSRWYSSAVPGLWVPYRGQDELGPRLALRVSSAVRSGE
jgi:hypothetical protein